MHPANARWATVKLAECVPLVARCTLKRLPVQCAVAVWRDKVAPIASSFNNMYGLRFRKHDRELKTVQFPAFLHIHLAQGVTHKATCYVGAASRCFRLSSLDLSSRVCEACVKHGLSISRAKPVVCSGCVPWYIGCKAENLIAHHRTKNATDFESGAPISQILSRKKDNAQIVKY